MADDGSTGDKTEQASPQKLKKAKEKGQVARSKDLATAVGLLAAIKITMWMAPSLIEDFKQLFWFSFADLNDSGAMLNVLGMVLPATMMLLLKMLMPLFVVPLAVVVASTIPGGFNVSSEHLIPKLNRVNPMSYFKRMATGKHWTGVLASVAKAAALSWVVYYLIRNGSADYVRLQGMPLTAAMMGGLSLFLDAVLAMCLVFVLFALIDVPIQKFFFMREQRMSKQDLKEEHKRQEGRPEVRQRIRQLQRALSQRSIRQAVPQADVIIVNPEHYAVALKYDEKRAEAPFVIAKGVDEMALYIRRVANDHAVDVVPLAPLARALYNTSQVNQQIPTPLYQAVALVLTYVLQLKAFRTGKRDKKPNLPSDLAVPKHLT